MVDISPDLLQRIKIAAANKDVSIQEKEEIGVRPFLRHNSSAVT